MANHNPASGERLLPWSALALATVVGLNMMQQPLSPGLEAAEGSELRREAPVSNSWAFTRTAVKRFMTIHATRQSEAEAQKLLAAVAARAGRLRELTPTGEFQWKVDEPPLILVTKREDGRNLCVTVRRADPRATLPPGWSGEDWIAEMAAETAPPAAPGGAGTGGTSGVSRKDWALRERRLLDEKRRLEEQLQASEAQRSDLAEAYMRLQEGLRIAMGTLKHDHGKIEVVAALRQIEKEARGLLDEKEAH
jgi:hypothetical protein